MRKYMLFAAIAVINIILLFFSAEKANSQAWTEGLAGEDLKDFNKVNEAFEEYWQNHEIEKGHGWKQYKRWQWFWEQRIGKDGKLPNAYEIYREWQSYETKHNADSPLNAAADWKELGPIDIPRNMLYYSSSGLGRINCIEFHPTDPRIFWVGAPAGGAWKTTDNGQSWEVAPFTSFMSIGVTDIQYAPSDPDIIYLATGDANGWQMTSGYSIGVIKSTDGGESWDVTNFAREIFQKVKIGEMIVHPDDAAVLVVCTSEGMYKSTDGGESWEQKSTDLYFRHLTAKPDDFTVLYASTFSSSGYSRIFKSTDFGETWEEKERLDQANRIELAVSEAAPDNVYALASRRYRNSFEGFYKSTDAGETWEEMSDSPNILSRSSNGSDNDGQGHYDLALAVSPQNPDLVFAGGVNTWYSTNGGRSWQLRTHWTGSAGRPYVHADQHFFKFKGGTNDLYAANDGGIYRTSNLGAEWEDISNGLSIQQFYRSGVSESEEKVIVGGSQDNGVQIYKDGKWQHIHGGDGMESLIDYKDPQYIYTENYYGSLYRSTNGGSNFRPILNRTSIGENGAWVTPFIMDPVDPKILYIGFENVWKTSNRGNNWDKISDFAGGNTLRSFAISPSDRNYIYAATRTVVYRTTDGGGSWENIFSAPNAISYLAVDPHDPEHIWTTISGYSKGKKVYEYIGGEWENISGTLPNVPANCITAQRGTNERLYVGTDLGVFYREKGMDDWRSFNTNMPDVIINELEIHYPSGTLYATTFGRGIWHTKIIDCDMEKPTLSFVGDAEFCEGDSLVVEIDQDYYSYEWSNGETGKRIAIRKSGEYFCAVTDDKGCREFTESIYANVIPVPNISISSEIEFPFCGVDSVELSATRLFFDEYEWSTGATTREIMVNKAGEYYVTGISSSGCPARDTIYVEFFPEPEKPEITRSGDTLISTKAETYRWYRNGDVVAHADERKYIPAISGVYYVETTDENGCIARSDDMTFETFVAEGMSDAKLSVVPNPGDGLFRLKADAMPAGRINITIINYMGNEVYSAGEYHNSGIFDKEIDLTGVPAGMYILRLRSGGKIFTAKIIRQ